MSDTSAFGFGKFVPGFDFLQNLAKSASGPAAATGAVPGMSSWVAPTLSVEELDKRIQELKAVQFWLEQNGTALKATIQALEVQKMTLSALKGMNVSLQDMAQAFGAKAPAAQSPAAPTWPAAAGAAPAAQAEPPAAKTRADTASPKPAARAQAGKSRAKAASQSAKTPGGQAAAGMVDPMQWWGALTQQFQQIASAAVADAQAQAQARAADAPPAEKAAGGQGAAPPRAPRKSKPKASR